MSDRRHLDALVVDVELVLISVVQGVALTTLAVEATPVLHQHLAASYPLAIAGLLFVLAFWSAALVHAVSFVSWPMDLVHYFFYFALALLECLTFGQMERPRDWFAYSCVAYVACLALYAYDDAMMRGRRVAFESTPARRRLFDHMLRRQRLELFGFMPAGIAFNAAAWWWLGRDAGAATAWGWAQVVLSLVFLADLVRAFGHRQRIIAEAAG